MRLARYALRRFVLLLITLFGVTVFTFGITNVLPGDVAHLIVGVRGDHEQLELIRRQLGLDRPLYTQYLDWLAGIFVGDFGTSLRYREPVAELISQRFHRSVLLAVATMIIAVGIAIPLGVYAALEQDSYRDHAASMLALSGISLPGFFWGLVLILVFGVWTGILPTSGYVSPREDVVQSIRHVILPASALAFGMMAHLLRMTRSSLIEEMRAGYIDLAKSKGLSDTRILFRHGLRNAFLPVLTVMGFQFALLFGGVVVIEVVFTYPGLGRLTYDAILNRDIPLIQGTVLVFAVVFTLSNLVVDLLYAILDPRVGEDL